MTALGAQHQAQRHASHRTGHHNGNRRTTTRQEHADIEHGARSGGHARDGHQQHTRMHRRHTSAHALPHPRAHNPSCTRARPDNMCRWFDSPVTCAPVGGQHAAQCMAACPPPSKGGSKGLGRGIASTQHTHSAWNRNLRLQGPSCAAACSCTLASVGLLHPGMIKGCSKSVAAPKDEGPSEQEGP